MSKLTPLQRIQRTHVMLMRSSQFCLLSGVLLCGKYELNETKTRTACTDGWNCWYNPKFVEKLTDKELAFVIAHENFHKLFKHGQVWRKLGKDKNERRLADLAMDFVVNAAIKNLDPYDNIVSLPACGFYNPDWSDLNTKQIFEILKTYPNKPDQMDDHEDSESELTPQQEAAIERAIYQGKLLAGKHVDTQVLELLNELTKPKVNWREELRAFIQSVTYGKDISTWRRPNRRLLSQNIYMPSFYSESIGELVVGIDTSGSIDQRELQEFVSELVGICRTVVPEKLHLVWWDTEVEKYQEFVPPYEDIVVHLYPTGGGGTDPRCVFKWIQKEKINPTCIIMLTDGFINNWGTYFGVSTLWVINTNVIAPWGKTLNV